MSDTQEKAICKTCGSEAPNHTPSIFDRDGIGHPDHAMSDIITIYEDWNEIDGKIYYRWRLHGEKEWHTKLTAYRKKPYIKFKYISEQELKELE